MPATTMNRRDFSTALLAAGTGTATLLSSGLAVAQNPEPVESRDFTKIEPPQPVDVPKGKGHVPCARWPSESLAEWHERHRLTCD